MSPAIQLRDEGFLARNVTFCLQDVSPSNRQRVFCRSIAHCRPLMSCYDRRSHRGLRAIHRRLMQHGKESSL
jgi:hypothetical protein